MAAVAFDTHKYIKSLEDAGVPLQQAEAQAKVLAEAIEVTLASKQDLQNIKNELKSDIADLKSELKSDMAGLKVEIANSKSIMIMWLVGAMIAQTGIIITILKMTH
jgi:phosphoribosyl-ATP pyrophosphohydrolase